MDMDITKLGERGQVVIPLDMRKGLIKGEKLIIIKEDNKFILEPIKKMKAKNINNIKEDIYEIKSADKAWGEIKKGKYNKYDNAEDFLKELKKW